MALAPPEARLGGPGGGPEARLGGPGGGPQGPEGGLRAPGRPEGPLGGSEARKYKFTKAKVSFFTGKAILLMQT